MKLRVNKKNIFAFALCLSYLCSMKIETATVESSKGTVILYTLTNNIGAQITLSSIGAGIVSVIVPDSKGNMSDVVLGYSDIQDYLYDGPCAGKIAGRFANRIAKGLFTIDGETHTLVTNCGPNHLHGGPDGFQNQLWDSELVYEGVRFYRVSEDGEEGYPGRVEVSVVYSWNDECELSIDMSATTNKKTIINLTNHSYFNLNGENSGSVLDHMLWMSCSKYLPTDDTLVPIGVYESVVDTPMDFMGYKALGCEINADYPALKYGKGYDNCWVVDNWEKGKLQLIAKLVSNKSGRVLEILTTQPAVQIYTGNWLSDSPINKSGQKYCDYDGVAIECQAMPDAPNKPMFPTTVLCPGETFAEKIIYRFNTIK